MLRSCTFYKWLLLLLSVATLSPLTFVVCSVFTDYFVDNFVRRGGASAFIPLVDSSHLLHFPSIPDSSCYYVILVGRSSNGTARLL